MRIKGILDPDPRQRSSFLTLAPLPGPAAIEPLAPAPFLPHVGAAPALSYLAPAPLMGPTTIAPVRLP